MPDPRRDGREIMPSVPIGRSNAIEAPSFWRRVFAAVTGAARTLITPGLRRGHTHDRLPIFRISRVWEDCWIVRRPGALIGHAFPDLASAAGFVRRECPDTPAAVELDIADLYVVAFHDPHKPGPMFGEKQRAGRQQG